MGWHTDVETGSTVVCGLASDVTYAGAGALDMAFTISPGGWVDCGRSFDGPQDWSSGTGLSVWLRSDVGAWGELMIFSGASDNATPFEASFEATDEWQQVVFGWDEFAKAEWAGDEGLAALDPTRMLGYGFSVGADAETVEGHLWIDDLALAQAAPGGDAPPPLGDSQPPSGDAPPPPSGPSADEPAPADGPAGESEGNGFCMGPAALPLGALGVWVVGRRRRR